MRDLDEALRRAPERLEYLDARADALESRKEWPRAVADRTRLIELDRGARRFARRADTYAAAGDFARARDATVPEVAADKARHDLSRALGRLRQSLGAVNQAQADLTRAEKAKNKSEAQLRRAIADDKRPPDEILIEVAGFVEDGTDDDEDYVDRARVYLNREKFALAIADCTKAIRIKPTRHEAYNLRGIAYENARDYDKAFADYDRAVSLAPTRAFYVRNRGDIHYEKRRFDAAWAD